MSAPAIVNVGLDLNHLGRFEEALVQFENALEIDPGYAGAHVVAGHYWLVEGRLDEAVVWIAKAISLGPGSPIFSASLGMLFLDLGDPNEGEYWIKRSVELGTGRFWPDRAMQLLRVYQGDEARRMETWERICGDLSVG